MSPSTTITPCPRCQANGHRVKAQTLHSLVLPQVLETLCDLEVWAFCDTPTCPVVYYDPAGATLEADAVSVPVGVKRTSAPRPLCYCFDHSVESLEREPHPEAVLDQIKGLMKTDGCRCLSTNPQGRCCLATVKAAIETIGKVPGEVPGKSPSNATGQADVNPAEAKS